MTARRFIIFIIFLLGFLASGGCKKRIDTAPPGGAPPGTPPEAGGAPTAPAGGGVLDPAQVKNGGAVSGTIRLDGPAPAPEPVDMTQKPECVKEHGDKPALKDNLVVGADKGLRDVFVYVKKGLEAYKFSPPAEPAVLDQKGCMYIPHVYGIMVNQDLKVLNSDPFTHNVNVKENAPFNLAMVKGQAPVVKEKLFKREGVPVTFQCDVHAWMRSYACVTKHPYHSVTGENGKFEIKNLPPGKYTVAVWHEPLRGLTAPSPAEVEIEVKEGETKTLDLTYTYKP